MEKLIENYNPEHFDAYIEECKKEGRYIEAYALADQLITGFLKELLDEEDLRISNSVILTVLFKVKLIDDGYYSLYKKFKKRRDDLIHNVLMDKDRFQDLQPNELDKTLDRIIRMTSDWMALLLVGKIPIIGPEIIKKEIQKRKQGL